MAFMSDRHIHILRVVARRRQQQLEEHDAAPATPQIGSSARRDDLRQTASRTRAQLVAAETRRRRFPTTAPTD
jgi:hypothetical protein